MKSNSIEDSIQNINSKKDKFSKPGVSIISIINRSDNIIKVFDNYSKQNYRKKELIIILNDTGIDLNNCINLSKQYNNIKVFKLNQKLNSGECRNFAFNHINFDYIAFFDNDFYAPNYLSEALKTFEKTDCDIVGKFTTYVYFVERKILTIKNWDYNFENQYSPGIVSSTMVFKRNLLDKIIFPNTAFAENKFQIYSLNYGFKIYSTGKYNYVKHITSDSVKETFLKIDEKNLLEEYKIIAKDITDYTNYIVLKNNKNYVINNKSHNKRNISNNKKTEEITGWGTMYL